MKRTPLLCACSVVITSLPRMPGNHVHGNVLPATFVPGRRNESEGYWAADESWKKITRFSFPLLLKCKMGFRNPSCLPHRERKTSPRSTALVNRISLQPFLRTRKYPALLLRSATDVEADFVFDQRLGNTRDRFLNGQNHLWYQKLHLCKRLVVLVLLKTRLLVSKFENPTPGTESSSFSQQRWKFLDYLGRSSTCSSLLAVEGRYGFQSTWN